MRRLTHHHVLALTPLTVSIRVQSSRRDTSQPTAFSREDAAPAGDEVTSSFPGDAAAQRPPPRRRRGTGEVDALLTDVLALGKRVADEQQRHRLSIPASQLGRLRPAPRAGSTAAPAEVSATPTTPPISPPPPRPSAVGRLRRAAAPSRPPPPPAASTAPPPLQSWTPSLVLTPEQLRATAAAHTASDIAFTLEELENTLFSPEAEATGDGAGAGVAPASTAAAAEAPVAPAAEHAEAAAPTPAAPPPPPPPPAPAPTASPSDAAPPSPPSTSPVGAPSTDSPPAAPPPPAVAAAVSPEVAPPAPVPVVRCRLRGTTVVVQLTRASPAPRALLEALQEAVTFAESLPPLPEGPREVRLGLYGSAASDGAVPAFVEAGDWVDVTSSGDERAAVQLLKERLLQRLAEGPTRGLRYVAEVRVGGDVSGDVFGKVVAPVPLVVRDTAAELLLACTALDLRHRGRPNAKVDATSVLQLSFGGIAVGVFPAPATVQHVTRAVEALCASDEGRGALCVAQLHVAATATPSGLVAALMPRLHELPRTASAALLAGCVGARHGGSEVKTRGTASAAPAHWLAALLETARAWWWCRVAQTYPFSGASAAASVRPAPAECVTATDVWRSLCAATAAADVTEDAVRQAVDAAAHAAPVWRCAQSYRRVATPLRLDAAARPVLPLVVDVTAAALQHTSVADLASEVREQPADVVLVLAESLRLQQKLQFLASLHLTDTGSHHRVTVLLPGDPGSLAECASLTASSACLTPQLPCGGRCGATVLPTSEPRWLHALVEVSAAAVSAAAGPQGATSATALWGEGSSPVALAAAYVTQTWRRPCVATASGTVGLTMSAAVAVAWQRLAAPGATTAAPPMRQRGDFQRTHLAPLILCPAEGGRDTGAAWWAETSIAATAASEDSAAKVASVPALMKQLGAAWPASPPAPRGVTSGPAGAAGCGVAFLFALDAACQCLLHRYVASPEVLDALSVAALGLDPSAGGILTVADRFAGGDTVDGIVAAVEGAAAVHGIDFASLPLLRWMARERLLLYQLTSDVLDRFARAPPSETE